MIVEVTITYYMSVEAFFSVPGAQGWNPGSAIDWRVHWDAFEK